MTWIIIGLVLVLAIGPAMYLLPSAKDNRLMLLRQSARSNGLTVQITTLPRLDPTDSERVTAGGKTLDPRRTCANYQLPMGRQLARAGEILLVKMPAEPTVPVREVIPGWSLDASSSDEFWQQLIRQPNVKTALEAHLGALPPGCYGCALNTRYVSCYWNEGPGSDASSVVGIKAELEALRDLLITHFGVLKDPANGKTDT